MNNQLYPYCRFSEKNKLHVGKGCVGFALGFFWSTPLRMYCSIKSGSPTKQSRAEHWGGQPRTSLKLLPNCKYANTHTGPSGAIPMPKARQLFEKLLETSSRPDCTALTLVCCWSGVYEQPRPNLPVSALDALQHKAAPCAHPCNAESVRLKATF